MAGRNAIAKRLDLLHDQWNGFAADADARLLRWLVRDDEYRMIEAFVQTEQDDAAGEIPDLFLRFDAPFENVNGYGASLRESLIAQYEAAREEVEGEGEGDEAEEIEGEDGDDEADELDLSWTPPPADGHHSLIAFLEACISLHAHHSDLMERLALILTPETISEVGDWERWLQALAERLPEDVRAAVVDSAEAPGLDALADALPKLVVTVPAELDMPGAVAELARAGGTSTPDGRFRVHFTAMTQSLGQGDLDGGRKHGEAAESVARENGWKHLVAAVYMALAGGYLGADRHDEAVGFYQEVDRVGAELEAETDEGEVGEGQPSGEAGEAGAAAEGGPGEPAADADLGPKLRLQAGMGAGAAWLSAGDFGRAAATYTGTVPHARKVGDPLMVLESWRMAAYCHEQRGEIEQAWECGLKAIDAGEEMPEGDRASSTLPHAGDGLMRLVDHSPEHARIIDERLTRLLGTPEWRAAASGPPDFT